MVNHVGNPAVQKELELLALADPFAQMDFRVSASAFNMAPHLQDGLDYNVQGDYSTHAIAIPTHTYSF